MESMEPIPQVSQPEQPPESTGCLSEVGWFFGGAVLPMGSLTFYRKAAQKSVGVAMAFFFVFTSIIACLLTASVTIGLYSASSGINEAYESGQIPKIVISNGVAEVDGPQPFVLLDDKSSQGERIIVALDTTGEITSIDEARYDQGLLLTRTELHFLNRGDYQVVPLSEINTLFEQDPLFINASTVTRAWGTFTIIFAVIALIVLWFWHFVLRLAIIVMYALVLWGIVSLARPGTGFSPVIISGLYAIVPVLYISRLFSRADISFPGLQSLFLFIFWTIALIASLLDHPMLKAERPLRGWTALIGAPMVILFIVDLVKTLPEPYGVPVLWAVFAFTFIAHAGVRAFFRFQESQKPSGEIPTL